MPKMLDTLNKNQGEAQEAVTVTVKAVEVEKAVENAMVESAMPSSWYDDW